MLTARWDAAAGAVIAYSLARPGPVDITVVDTRGQLAARLAHGASEAGSHRLVWGGADAHGRTVAPGCYVVSIAAPGFTRRVPLTIAR